MTDPKTMTVEERVAAIVGALRPLDPNRMSAVYVRLELVAYGDQRAAEARADEREVILDFSCEEHHGYCPCVIAAIRARGEK